MTNIIAPFGFQDYNRMEGGSPQFGFPGNQLNIASSDPTPIFDGDLVQLLPASSVATGNVGKYITQGSSGLTTNTCWEGIFRGCHYINTNIQRPVWAKYWPGGGTGVSSQADAIAFVETDVRKWFIAQVSTTGGVVLGTSNIGQNISVYPSTGTFAMTSSIGNTTTGYSGMALASSTVGTSNVAPFRIIDFLSNVAPGFQPFQANNTVGASAFINGVDNTNVGQILVVAMNNFGPNQLTGM